MSDTNTAPVHYEIFTTVPQMFSRLAEKFADEPALSGKVGGVYTPVTFRELDRRARAFAAALSADLGLERGELVALVCNNRIEWMVASVAIHYAGAVDVPRASDTPAEILKAILRHARPAVVVLEKAAQIDDVREALPELRALVLIDAPQGDAAGADSGGDLSVFTLDDLLARGADLVAQDPEVVERRRSAVSPEDLATVIYTSGTTGTPKGVALTHGNYMLNINVIPFMLGLSREPLLSILQPWHAYERQAQLMSLSVGCCVHFGSVLTLRSDLKAVRPTVMPTVPELWVTLYKGVWQKIAAQSPGRQRLARTLIAGSLAHARARRVLDDREPLLAPESAALRQWRRGLAVASAGLTWPLHALADRLVYREIRANLGGRLRFPVVGGGPLPDAIDEFFDAVGLPLLEGYGMTEAMVVIACRDHRHRVLKTAGRVLDGMEGRIEAEDGSECAVGEAGRLRVRGPNVMRGYYKDEAATAAVLDAGGWLDTGDLARQHVDGSIRVLSRLDDTLVLSTGKNVNAVYLENELRSSEWIERAVVVGAGRAYTAAFVAPSRPHLEDLARKLSLSFSDPREVLEHPGVVEHYRELALRITGDAGKFAAYERVQRVRLWLEEFRIGRELSQTLKLRRHEFYRLYAAEIEQLYAE